MPGTQKNIRVLICNRHALFRDGLKALFLPNDDHIEIIGEAGTARRAIDQAQHLRPDVVLMDLAMPDMGGFETMVRIHAIDPNIRVLILTLSDDQRTQATRCLEAGAAGEIGRKVLPSQLRATIVAAVGRRGAHRAMSSGGYGPEIAHRG